MGQSPLAYLLVSLINVLYYKLFPHLSPWGSLNSFCARRKNLHLLKTHLSVSCSLGPGATWTPGRDRALLAQLAHSLEGNLSHGGQPCGPLSMFESTCTLLTRTHLPCTLCCHRPLNLACWNSSLSPSESTVHEAGLSTPPPCVCFRSSRAKQDNFLLTQTPPS